MNEGNEFMIVKFVEFEIMIVKCLRELKYVRRDFLEEKWEDLKI